MCGRSTQSNMTMKNRYGPIRNRVGTRPTVSTAAYRRLTASTRILAPLPSQLDLHRRRPELRVAALEARPAWVDVHSQALWIGGTRRAGSQGCDAAP
jgi:hypothetical protein